jgi:hypothetical protein
VSTVVVLRLLILGLRLGCVLPLKLDLYGFHQSKSAARR